MRFSLAKKGSRSTTRSLMMSNPDSGSIFSLVPKRWMGVSQASTLRPLTFMAQEPQMELRQERR